MKMLGSKIIETERLILKPQTMEEQEYLWSVLMIPEVNRLYLTVPRKFRDKLMSSEKQEPFYKADMEHANDPNVFRWSLFLKETGECIGKYSCQDGPYEETPEIRDVGWYIDPKHNGKGY
jgi:RimJ/RimL family protein N-acetyltransferase